MSLETYATNEPHRAKTGFCLCENRRRLTAKLISAFVFATRIVQFLFFLNPKFQASSRLCDCTGRFVSDLVGHPEDPFSRVAAHPPPDKRHIIRECL